MPLSLFLDADGTEKKISVKNAIILILLALEAAAIYHRFETNEQDLKSLKELHSQEIQQLKEKIDYERERVDRKFKQFQ